MGFAVWVNCIAHMVSLSSTVNPVTLVDKILTGVVVGVFKSTVGRVVWPYQLMSVFLFGRLTYSSDPVLVSTSSSTVRLCA